MESEQNTKLLESCGREPSGRQSNLVGCQVAHDLLDALRISRKLLVINYVSFNDLFC